LSKARAFDDFGDLGHELSLDQRLVRIDIAQIEMG